MVETMDRLRTLQPQTAADLERAQAAALQASDPERLERCRARMAEMLGVPSKGGAAPAGEPTAADRAFLDFTEQFVFSVPAITDADVESLLEHVSAEEAYAFISALYVLEMSTRMDLVLAATLTPQEATA